MTVDDPAPPPAHRILEVLMARNAVARSLGIGVESAVEGSVTLAMTVREDMTNSAGSCHGGSSSCSPTRPAVGRA